MSMSVGASSSNALSYLQSLLQQGTSGAGDAKKSSASDPLAMLMQAISGDGTSSGQTSSTATATSASTGSSSVAFSADTMSALLSAQGQQSTSGADAKLFAKLDTNGDGTISKDEFSAATSKAGVDSSLSDAVFSKMDANGDGSVSQDELTKADKGGGHGHIGGGQPSSNGESSGTSAAASGATTSTTTNADGSTTTSITYADGSKVTMTTAAAQSSDTSSGSSTDSSTTSSSTKSAFDLLQQLIKLQSQMLTAATSTMSTVA
jgi:hypothetical protein